MGSPGSFNLTGAAGLRLFLTKRLFVSPEVRLGEILLRMMQLTRQGVWNQAPAQFVRFEGHPL